MANRGGTPRWQRLINAALILSWFAFAIVQHFTLRYIEKPCNRAKRDYDVDTAPRGGPKQTSKRGIQP